MARAWADRLAAGDLDGAMRCYSADAVVLADGEVEVGLTRIRRHWSGSSLLGGPPPSSIQSEDGTVVLRWEEDPPEGYAVESHLRIARGEIIEHRHGFEWRTHTVGSEVLPIHISARGEVTDDDRELAVREIGRTVLQTGVPVQHTTIRLERVADPRWGRPALAHVFVDVDGTVVRANVAADDMGEAIERLDRRLRQRLAALASRRPELRPSEAADPGGHR